MSAHLVVAWAIRKQTCYQLPSSFSGVKVTVAPDAFTIRIGGLFLYFKLGTVRVSVIE